MQTTTFSRRRWSILAAFSPCLLLFAGCDGSSSGTTTISSQQLSGKVGGQAWTFTQGETDSFLSDSSTFFMTLYASTFTACSTLAPPEDAGTIIMVIPRTPGSYDLSAARSATFSIPPSDNWVALQGHVQISEVTATTITGGAKITYNGDNTVEGQFQASICQ